MIKKFDQYFKEEKLNDLSEIITIEDIDDHFLRLQEILNCHIDILSQKNGGTWNKAHPGDKKVIKYSIYIKSLHSKIEFDKFKIGISKELNSIKKKIRKYVFNKCYYTKKII